MDRPAHHFGFPRAAVSPLNLSDQSGTGSMMSDRTGDIANWTSMLNQQSRQRRYDAEARVTNRPAMNRLGTELHHHLEHLQQHSNRADHSRYANPSCDYAAADSTFPHTRGAEEPSLCVASTAEAEMEFVSDCGDDTNEQSQQPSEAHITSRRATNKRSLPSQLPQRSPPPPRKRGAKVPTTRGVAKVAEVSKGSASSQADTDMYGAWNEETKLALIDMVEKEKPRGTKDWQCIAENLGRPQAGASAERMFRSLKNPDYQRVANKHGRRLNPRKGIPMHVMATYALLLLPDREGNLSEMATKIEDNKFFCKHLDWTPRPGTKTYPRCVS